MLVDSSPANRQCRGQCYGAGDYNYRVNLPSEPELATLAGDINALGEALDHTEAARLRSLGEVAHEIRTPLTMIDGVVEKIQERLSLVSVETRRLRRFSDDLLALSRAQEDAVIITSVAVDLQSGVDEVCDRLTVQVEDAGIAFIAQGSFGKLHGDPDRIVQVLTNLIGNAICATISNGAITITRDHLGAVARIHVSDTGVGIVAEDIECIFERFYRTEPDRISEGSKVGLTIARKLMRGMGGNLHA